MDDRFIEVLVPIADFATNYGVHSTTHHTASRITIRVTAEWRERVNHAAKLLNMSEADFIRTATSNMAKSINEKEKAHAQHDNRSR